MRFIKVETGTYQVFTVWGYIGTVNRIKRTKTTFEWRATAPGYSARGFETRRSAGDALARNHLDRAFKEAEND